jgi:UDP-N-acetylglucosamine--N-acetylmuramyl-(pentapeptide) pyrophosphoryl-undecaprenol N-acetylglucosamine transferase
MKALLAGGGTGGHVIPALAIADELRSRYHAQVEFIGTRRGIETRLVPNAGFTLHLVDVGQLKNVSLATRARTLLDLPRAIVRAAQIIQRFRPDVVIGVGGYASGPAMLAAALLGVRTVAFEPNVVPGFANRIIAPVVSAAAVQFEETCRYFRNCRITGVPVRREFFAASSALHAHPPTLLVFGGSQGAHSLNVAMIEALPQLAARWPGLHIVHQTGERDYKDATAAYLEAGISAELSPFIDNMPEVMARAALLVCRSGASTVAEVTAAAKPAVFVPFPRAADDHQRRNAEALVNKQAALLLPEAELTGERLLAVVTELFTEPARLATMAAAARALAHPQAAAEIAELAARIAGGEPRPAAHSAVVG